MIQYLTSHVIYGRSFLEKICAKIDFDEVMIRFKRGEDPLTFDSDPVTVAIVVIVVLNCSLHAEAAFTIPPESEIIVLNAELPLKKTVFGLVVSRNDFPHCYSIFGASELVRSPRIALFQLEWLTRPLIQLKYFAKQDWVTLKA